MSNPEIKLTLRLSAVNVIVAGLGKLPLETAVEVWASVKRQAEAQVSEFQRLGNDAQAGASPETPASPPARTQDAPEGKGPSE